MIALSRLCKAESESEGGIWLPFYSSVSKVSLVRKYHALDAFLYIGSNLRMYHSYFSHGLWVVSVADTHEIFTCCCRPFQFLKKSNLNVSHFSWQYLLRVKTERTRHEGGLKFSCFAVNLSQKVSPNKLIFIFNDDLVVVQKCQNVHKYRKTM